MYIRRCCWCKKEPIKYRFPQILLLFCCSVQFSSVPLKIRSCCSTSMIFFLFFLILSWFFICSVSFSRFFLRYPLLQRTTLYCELWIWWGKHWNWMKGENGSERERELERRTGMMGQKRRRTTKNREKNSIKLLEAICKAKFISWFLIFHFFALGLLRLSSFSWVYLCLCALHFIFHEKNK